MRLLARREHSRAELARKLAQRGYAGEPLQAALDRLAAQGLQSDRRFAEHYVGMRRNRGYGPLRIRAELRQRGLDEALIDAELDDTEDWEACLAALITRRFGPGVSGVGRAELARRARFLLQRGFPEAMVRRALAPHWDP